MERKILGFKETEIVSLYNYLCIYEKKLKSLDSNKRLFSDYPKLKEIDNLVEKLNCKEFESGSPELVKCNTTDCFVEMTWSRSSKLTSFMHHLRNAIGHSCIEKQEDCIKLKDYDTPKMRNITARGRINPSVLFEIINFINKEVII